MRISHLVLVVAAVVLFVAAGFFWKSRDRPTPVAPPPPAADVIPPGIIVHETTRSIPPPAAFFPPGDAQLADYGTPGIPPAEDLRLLSVSITNFLIVAKRASEFPLSANEEWSAALRGLRPGSEPWISAKSPLLDAQNRLIDRWGTPLHFHALGDKRWELRSAGPDRKLFTDDDLLEPFTD